MYVTSPIMASTCLLYRASTDPKQRRKLHSALLTHVRRILEELLCELSKSPTAIAPQFCMKTQLCQPCIKNVERLKKLRKDVREKEKENSSSNGRCW